MYFARTVRNGAFGQLRHDRALVAIDKQDVIPMNRDTLYSSGVFDLDAGPVTIMLPDVGKRVLSQESIPGAFLAQGAAARAEQEKQQREQAQTRKLQIGSGDRSERIRTYNFPQGRVTDHRIELTIYRLPDIIDGRLDELIGPLTPEYQAEQLAAQG